MSDRYEFARLLARDAGAVALDYWRRREELVVELKGPGDFVSLADREVEALLRREIAAAFPGDGFLGEETAAQFDAKDGAPVDRCWVVDPIDGTHNFLRGIPYWNVAIAYVENGRATIGAVFDPPHDELYHATRGGGAWCDAKGGTTRLRVAGTAALQGAFVALGHHDRSASPEYLELRRKLMVAGVAMRNFGSAALQLAHVAAGRLDGFIELELSIWDAIGALAIVDEAGGFTAPFAPPRPTAKAACLACAPGIAQSLGAMVEVGG
ncbi:MAG: inositol monophosphatase family protein [Betaproteobacteria bacterium]